MTRVLNAFQSVRPRGVQAPSAAPRPQHIGRAPGLLAGSSPMQLAMDRNGKLCVPLAPRANSGLVVEGRVQGQAATDKRRALVKGGI